MDREKFVDLIRPNSGCELANSMGFAMFDGLCRRTNNICDGCAFNPCEKMKQDEQRAKDIKKANFGKPTHETNAQIAKRLGVSKRQIAKMRRRGEL